MRITIGILGLILFAACAPLETSTPKRSAITMNSGIPLSDGVSQYEVQHYELRNAIDPARKAISGSSVITFRAVTAMTTLELDFDGLFVIDSVSDADGSLQYTRDDAKLYIELRNEVAAGKSDSVKVAYYGQPQEALRPPWAGGFQWSTTPSG